LQLFIGELENHKRSHLEYIGGLTAEVAKEIINRSHA